MRNLKFPFTYIIIQKLEFTALCIIDRIYWSSCRVILQHQYFYLKYWISQSCIYLSLTLLLLGLPWLTGTGDFLSRDWQQLSWWMFMHWAICRLICFHKGLQEPKALQTNKTWLSGWNSGLLRWGQAFIQVVPGSATSWNSSRLRHSMSTRGFQHTTLALAL